MSGFITMIILCVVTAISFVFAYVVAVKVLEFVEKEDMED